MQRLWVYLGADYTKLGFTSKQMWGVGGSENSSLHMFLEWQLTHMSCIINLIRILHRYFTWNNGFIPL